MPKVVAQEVTRKRILDAAQELFFRHGIRSITMDDISKHLGISKRTIYETYDDKETIVDELTLIELTSQQKDLDTIKKNSENAVDEIIKIVDYVAKCISKMNRNVMYDLQKFHPQAWYQFREFKEKKMLPSIEDNFRRGIKQELYRRDLPIKIMSRLRLEEVELGFNPKVFPPEQFNLPEVQVALLEHFLIGISTVKGHKLINKYMHITESE